MCRRLQFGAILASTNQRLVKYPLLLDSLNKEKKDSSDADYDKVAEAAKCCRHILNYVNDAIKQCEDEARLKELSTLIEDRRSTKTTLDESSEGYDGEEKPKKEVQVGVSDKRQVYHVIADQFNWPLGDIARVFTWKPQGSIFWPKILILSPNPNFQNT